MNPVLAGKEINMKEKVKLVLVIDASGSMQSTQIETVTAVENLIKEHRELEGKKVHLQIYTFDNVVRELVPTTKLKKYNNEFSSLYTTGGLTALYDAISRAVDENKENTKYAKTSLIILTDGAENSSQKFNEKDVSERLTHVQDNLGWDVTYLGAKREDFENHTFSLGIKKGKSIQFNPDAVGQRSASLTSATTLSTSYFSGTGF